MSEGARGRGGRIPLRQGTEIRLNDRILAADRVEKLLAITTVRATQIHYFVSLTSVPAKANIESMDRVTLASTYQRLSQISQRGMKNQVTMHTRSANTALQHAKKHTNCTADMHRKTKSLIQH